MSKRQPNKPLPSEQQVLDNAQIVLITKHEDIERCDKLIIEHHYLKDATLVGEQLRYALVYKGQWCALATWGAAAFHLKARDQFIGWSAEQLRARRPLIANNTRLLVLPGWHLPNLVSRFMKLMLARISDDWLEHWKHPLAMVETFVDPKLYQGTVYKVSGWSHLGRTAGWKRDAADFYQKHQDPKQIWVRELRKGAIRKLRAPALPPEWASVEKGVEPRCTAKAPEIRSLMEHLLASVPEFRRAQALAYPAAGLAALLVMAMATGARKGPDDLALYAQTLSQGQLRALRFRRDRKTGVVRCPKKTVFHTFLASINAELLEDALLSWQNQLLGPAQDKVVLVDGKEMRGGGLEMVNAATGGGRFLGSVITPDKTNEITAARTVLQKLDLAGKTVVADALHTNAETARQILYDQGGDYILTVKGNQPELQKTLAALFVKNSFSPSAEPANPGQDAGGQPGAAGDPLN